MGTWMVLGSYPFWFHWTLAAKISLFCGFILALSALFYSLFGLNQRFINQNKDRSKFGRTALVILLGGVLLTLLLRHQIPVSFSFSLTPEHVEIIQQFTSEPLTSESAQTEFKLSLRPGKLLLHPFVFERVSLVGQGQSAVRSFQYVYFKNRLTAKANLSYDYSANNQNITINTTAGLDSLSIELNTDANFSQSIPFYENPTGYKISYAVDLAFGYLCLLSLLCVFYYLLKWVWKVFYSCLDRFFIFIINKLSTLIPKLTIKSWKFWSLMLIALLALISLFAQTFLHSIFWFVSILCIGATTVLLLALLKVTGWKKYLIGFSLLVFGNILLSTQLAGIIGWLNKVYILPIFHLILLAISFTLFKRSKVELFPVKIKSPATAEIKEKLETAWKSDPELFVLGSATLFAYLIVAILALIVPSNMDDTLTTYLPRAAYWLQQGSFLPWPTSAYNLPQVVYPLNGQLPLAWWIGLWGNDALTRLLQFFSIPAGLVGIYGLSRALGARRKQALFAAFIFLGLPEIVILSSTALTDMLVANLFIVLFYLLIVGIKENDRSSLLLSALSLGITLGIKQTAFFMAPGLMIIVLLYVIIGKRKNLPNLVYWAGFSILSFLIFSSFIYIQNLVNYGKLLGPEELTPYFTHAGNSNSLINYIETGFSSYFKLIIRAFFDNLPVPVLLRMEYFLAKFDPTGAIFGTFIPRYLYEFSVAWSGQIGYLLLTITFFTSLIHSIKNKKWIMLAIVLSVLGYTTILMAIRNFTIASTRYLISVVVLLIPLLFMVTQKKWVRNVLVINSILMMAITLVFDGAKPLVGPNAIWGRSQNELRNLQLFDDYLPTFNAMDEFLPQDATIGIILPNKFPQSYLFGEDFTRKVIQLDPDYDQVYLSQLEQEGIQYLVVDPNLVDNLRNLSKLPVLYSEEDGRIVIYKVGVSTANGNESQ